MDPDLRDIFPIALKGAGEMRVNADLENPDAYFSPTTANILHLTFDAPRDLALTLGEPGKLTLTIGSNTRARIRAIFAENNTGANAALLSDYGLEHFYPDAKDRFLIALELGASAADDLHAPF